MSIKCCVNILLLLFLEDASKDIKGDNLFFLGVKIVFPPMQYFRNVSLYIRMPVGV